MDTTLDPSRVEQLFHVVAELGDDEAERVLDRECARGTALRREVERLLRYDRRIGPNFLAPNTSLLAALLAAAGRASEAGAPEEVLRAPEKVGRFVVLDQLGAGAMAVVYLGYDPSLDRRVALKVLRRGFELPEYMAREARALARLAHPNVVQVYETGVHDGQPFIAMELVSGLSLRAWLVTNRSPGEILRAFVQAGHGLAAAHAAGLVHRDFKPDNVLVGTDGRVRVADFGISALNEPGSESEHTSPGTPAYMAPEQLLGERASQASDQFAFCVSLYRSLYGVAPFAGDDIAALKESVVAGRLRVAPTTAEVPNWVARVLTRGLSRAPGERFSNMSQLLEAMERRLPARPELDPVIGRRERRWVALMMCLLGAAALVALVFAHAFRHQQLTLEQSLFAPTVALVIQICAAIAYRRRLFGNVFARKIMLVVWLSIVTVLVHRALALHFREPIAQVLGIDMLMLGLEHLVAALVFESWFAMTAALFFAGTAAAVVLPDSAAAAMLGSVSVAYLLAAVRIGV